MDSTSVLAREDAEHRDDVGDRQIRHHVVVRLAAALLRKGEHRVQRGGRRIVRFRRRVSIRVVGRRGVDRRRVVVVGDDRVIVDRDLLRRQRDGRRAGQLSEGIIRPGAGAGDCSSAVSGCGSHRGRRKTMKREAGSVSPKGERKW